jgi:hypothetical protein
MSLESFLIKSLILDSKILRYWEISSLGSYILSLADSVTSNIFYLLWIFQIKYYILKKGIHHIQKVLPGQQNIKKIDTAQKTLYY